MNWFKTYLQDFPGQNGGVFVALFLILLTGLVVDVRLAVGLTFPVGYDSWLILLGSLAGVTTLGMVGKRLSDVEYKKAGVAAPSPVSVAAPSTVTVSPTPVVPMADMPPKVLTKADADAAAKALEENQRELSDKDKP